MNQCRNTLRHIRESGGTLDRESVEHCLVCPVCRRELLALLAAELGMSENNILLPDIGNCVELSKQGMQFGESVSSGSRLVDGANLEDRENSVVMKDRKQTTLM